MARRGNTLLTLIVAGCLFAALPARSQVLPDPSVNRTYLIRAPGGTIIYHLIPRRDHYEVFGRKSRVFAAGVAKRLGNRLIIYNLRSQVIGIVRPELLPPDSELSAIAIVRDAEGNQIGILARY